jgi:hypothetical protein
VDDVVLHYSSATLKVLQAISKLLYMLHEIRGAKEQAFQINIENATSKKCRIICCNFLLDEATTANLLNVVHQKFSFYSTSSTNICVTSKRQGFHEKKLKAFLNLKKES